MGARGEGALLGGTGGVEVDDDFFKGNVKLGQGNVRALGPCEGGLALEWVVDGGGAHTGAAVVGVENELVGGHDGGCDGQSVVAMVTSAGFVNVRKSQVVVSGICISFGDPLFLYPSSVHRG